MSETAEFRVTLSLNHFFTDYRSTSKMFINKKTRTVEQFIKHVQDIFKIQKPFFLMCQHFYLPSCEDIRIIKEDDHLIALPQNWITDVYSELDCKTKEKNSKKKTRKKKIIEEPEIDDIAPISCDSERKSKKRKYNSTCTRKSDEKDDPLETMTIDASKKHKVNLIDNDEDSTSSSEFHLPQSVDKSSKCSARNESGDLFASTPKINNSINRKVLPIPLENTLPKIVKTIHITPSNPNKSQEIDELSDSSINNTLKQNEKEDAEITSSSVKETVDVDELEKPIKKKRKRIRKHKRNQKTPEIIKEILTPFIPKIVANHERKHVKFNSDSDSDTNSAQQMDSINNIKENCKINLNIDEGNNMLKNGNETNFAIEVEKHNFNLPPTTENMLLYPLMDHLFPKENDIIAFKMLRLSSSYTPVISNYIIAKVIKYEKELDKVTLHIIEGRQTFNMPQGKFSVEENCEEEENDNIKQMCWRSLIEPRLMFP